MNLSPRPSRSPQRASLRKALFLFAFGSALFWQLGAPILTGLLITLLFGMPPREELSALTIWLLSLTPFVLYMALAYAFMRWALPRYATELGRNAPAKLDSDGSTRT